MRLAIKLRSWPEPLSLCRAISEQCSHAGSECLLGKRFAQLCQHHAIGAGRVAQPVSIVVAAA